MQTYMTGYGSATKYNTVHELLYDCFWQIIWYSSISKIDKGIFNSGKITLSIHCKLRNYCEKILNKTVKNQGLSKRLPQNFLYGFTKKQIPTYFLL